MPAVKSSTQGELQIDFLDFLRGKAEDDEASFGSGLRKRPILDGVQILPELLTVDPGPFLGCDLDATSEQLLQTVLSRCLAAGLIQPEGDGTISLDSTGGDTSPALLCACTHLSGNISASRSAE